MFYPDASYANDRIKDFLIVLLFVSVLQFLRWLKSRTMAKEWIKIRCFTVKGKSGIGVANTHRRLTQLYGQGLSIASRPDEG
ncbi:hypothetical protein EDM55_12190 [Brevibacillus centrosporus]|nr:hypothetical protein EDM55_12190 [Brevibacillus centrosporus]